MSRGRTDRAKLSVFRSRLPLIYGERDSHVVLLDCFFILSLVFKAPESPQFPPERPLEAPQLGRKPELGKAH